jgi:hypothetical protein
MPPITIDAVLLVGTESVVSQGFESKFVPRMNYLKLLPPVMVTTVAPPGAVL